jgi:hypothetical protein
MSEQPNMLSESIDSLNKYHHDRIREDDIDSEGVAVFASTGGVLFDGECIFSEYCVAGERENVWELQATTCGERTEFISKPFI